MKTDGGWVSISECARLYGRHRKWVSDQIERYNIETRKVGNQKQLRLTDMIQHRGEPQGDETARNANHREESQIIADAVSPKNGELETEIRYLKRAGRVPRGRHSRAQRTGAWLRGQVALPAPERNGWTARLRDWWRNT